MPGHDIIVIGASAGGVEAISQVIRDLPADLPAAIFVVLHLPPQAPSLLPHILTRRGDLPAVHPADGDAIRQGQIYVAPPDQHLLVKKGRVRVIRGPHENRHRPAVDPLFRSAALAYGARVIGVVLSGVLDDGTAGLLAVKQRGGIAVVQSPEDALYIGMPASAIENVVVDHVLPAAEIGGLLDRMARRQVEKEGAVAVSDEMKGETDLAEIDTDRMREEEHPGTPSAFACPDCGGSLWEMREGELLRFRCRVGHAYSANSLLSAQSDTLDAALWTALRALEESASLARRLAERAGRRGHALSVAQFEAQAREAETRAEVIRRVLLKEALDPAPVPEADGPLPGEGNSNAPDAAAP
jgi:two-component system chemotaxis response regulator CheB